MGSRTRGDALPLSDWDFKITTRAFAGVQQRLPSVAARLRPVVAQWDRCERPGGAFVDGSPAGVQQEVAIAHPFSHLNASSYWPRPTRRPGRGALLFGYNSQ
jgi:hypothetical protein